VQKPFGAIVALGGFEIAANKNTRSEQTMRPKMIMGFAALALGTVVASAPALAKTVKHSVQADPPSYSNTTASGAPLSPGGISAAASAYGGPGYNGTGTNGQPVHVNPVNYSNTGPNGAPLSPGGISAAASAYGGPGYNGTGTNGQPVHVNPVNYSNTGPSGAPLSPGGISAAASAYGGPGYVGR
jgi:hypothetical protein